MRQSMYIPKSQTVVDDRRHEPHTGKSYVAVDLTSTKEPRSY